MICHVEGVVVHTHKMKESSLVAVVFTREWGKLRLAANGARRPKSRFGSSLQPVTCGNYVFYRREGRDLQTVTEGDVIDPFRQTKADYERLAYASAICDLLEHSTVEEDRNPLLYSILLDALRWVDSVEKECLELPLWYFQIKSAGCLGYRPQLSGCVLTGVRLTGSPAWFSPEFGGTVNERVEGLGMWISLGTVAFLEALQCSTPDRISTKGFEAVDKAEARNALRMFMAHHVGDGRNLKSFDFLDKLFRGSGRRRKDSRQQDSYTIAAEPKSTYTTNSE